MIILADLSENTVQCPKPLFLCLFQLQAFDFLFNGLIQAPKTRCNQPIPATKKCVLFKACSVYCTSVLCVLFKVCSMYCTRCAVRIIQGAITQNMYRCVLLQLFCSEMHRREGLKLVLYRTSIENNNKKNLVTLKKKFFDTFGKDFTFFDVPP